MRRAEKKHSRLQWPIAKQMAAHNAYFKIRMEMHASL